MAIKFDEFKALLTKHGLDKTVSEEFLVEATNLNTVDETPFDTETFKKEVIDENNKMWLEKYDKQVKEEVLQRARDIFFKGSAGQVIAQSMGEQINTSVNQTQQPLQQAQPNPVFGQQPRETTVNEFLFGVQPEVQNKPMIQTIGGESRPYVDPGIAQTPKQATSATYNYI